MTDEIKEQQRKRLYAEFLRRLREAPTEMQINMRADDNDQIEIEDDGINHVDREHTSLNWWYRHNAMHAGTIPMLLDEFGRCAYCVKRGFWEPDA